MSNRILVVISDFLHVSSTDVRDMLRAFIGTLATNTTGKACPMELEQRMRPDALVSVATIYQPSFYKNVRELLRLRGFTGDPPIVAPNETIDTKLIRTICPVASAAISDPYRRVQH